MIPALGFTAAYIGLFVVVLWRRTRRNPADSWLIGYCAFSAVLVVLHTAALYNPSALPQSLSSQFLMEIGLVFSTGLITLMTLAYLAIGRRVMISVITFTVVWAGVTIALNFLDQPSIITYPDAVVSLFDNQITASTELVVAGWFLVALMLLIFVWRAFLGEPLPMYANRILFWAIIIPFLLAGDFLAAWVNPPWHFIGYGIRLLGAIGAVYAVVQHRVIDIRNTARWVISHLIITLVTGLLIFAGILSPSYIAIPGLGPEIQRWIIAGGTALMIALFMPLILRFVRWLLRSLISRGTVEPTEILRSYSQQVNEVIDLAQLAEVAINAICELLATRDGALILATTENDTVALLPVNTDKPENDPQPPGILSVDSPLYQFFVNKQQPVLQYDLDYDKRFISLSARERHYFSRLEMDIYAPIVGNEQLLGLLAIGPKRNDDPFQASEIELLDALAHQTVVALENARLVANLRRLNERISALNIDLKTTNERLERLDNVKSDFLVIASHELRTPLTQIQGYTDLLSEMVKMNLLDPQETKEITASLVKSTHRMTEVVSSMLDVTQIDVESLDLNFVETSLANILKLSVEPYSDAINKREQNLVARGLSDLPPIQADYKRLVQAFKNLISNAIKFTPDKGKIKIRGQVYDKDEDGNPVSVKVSIKDSGIGVDKADQELIFEKFYRVGEVALHSTGDTKFKGAGPGLGLPIARGIIEGHGGRIWVESEGMDEAQFPGSVFHVVLPLRPPAIDAQKRLAELQVSGVGESSN